MKKTTIVCENGYDTYVATPDAQWPTAIKRMQSAVTSREGAMSAWEAANRPAGHPDSDYWQRYNAFKATMPVSYPLPEKHVRFGC